MTLTLTYVHHNALAEAGASVEPVIVLELVDLDALAIVGRWRYQGHSPREGSAGTRAATDVPSAARNAVATGRAGLGRAARVVPRARWGSGVVCDVRAGQMTIRRLGVGVGGRQMRRLDRGATGRRSVLGCNAQCARGQRQARCAVSVSRLRRVLGVGGGCDRRGACAYETTAAETQTSAGTGRVASNR